MDPKVFDKQAILKLHVKQIWFLVRVSRNVRQGGRGIVLLFLKVKWLELSPQINVKWNYSLFPLYVGPYFLMLNFKLNFEHWRTQWSDICPFPSIYKQVKPRVRSMMTRRPEKDPTFFYKTFFFFGVK